MSTACRKGTPLRSKDTGGLDLGSGFRVWLRASGVSKDVWGILGDCTVRSRHPEAKDATHKHLSLLCPRQNLSTTLYEGRTYGHYPTSGAES